MAVTLSSREIAQLQKALDTILSPISHSSPEEWGRAVMRDVKQLLRADQVFFALPLDGSIHITGHGERTADAAGEYERDYWQTDFVISQRRKALGLEVHHRDQLYKPGELERDVLHNEWCVPNKLFDTLGIAVDVSGGPIPAGVNVYHDRATSRPFGERGQALMHLLLPAFKASVLSYRLLIRLRESMSQLIDEIPAGACILDALGQVIHQNRQLELYYLDEPESALLRSAVSRVGRSITHVRSANETSCDEPLSVPAMESLHTATNIYEIRGTRFTDLAFFPGAVAMVVVDSVRADDIRRRKVATQVRNQFRLTRRETEVALLLARRFTADEIAATLGISPHTARHHTENIFSKTAVSSRSMIADLFDR